MHARGLYDPQSVLNCGSREAYAHAVVAEGKFLVVQCQDASGHLLFFVCTKSAEMWHTRGNCILVVTL